MCIVINLDMVCLICLQHDKQMHSIYTPDPVDGEHDDDTKLVQKISTLSELKLDKNNESLPDKICDKCLKDLRAAWRFHKNCQSAKMIFQTIVSCNNRATSPSPVELDETTPQELAEQKYKVPQGLQIKRVLNDINEDEGETLKSIIPTNVEESSSIQNKSQDVLEIEDDSTPLYEELAHHELITGDDEFQNLAEVGLEDEEQTEEEEQQNDEEDKDEEVEQHELVEDEGALIEFYLTDDVEPEEQLQNIENVINTMVTKKYEKGAQLMQKPRSRGRPRQVQEELPRSSKQQAQPKFQKQTVIQNGPKSSTQNIPTSTQTSINKIFEPKEVREVRTRKRKSLSPDTKPPKICEICGNSYRFQHALNSHMRRHYNDKPFPCECCDKAFVSNVELRRHMRVHTGVKPYACQYCERRFSDFGSRIKHERTHTGERPYVCVTCGKAFAYPHVLSVHLRTHTGEKRFRCEYCSKGFTKKAYLQSHMEQYHINIDNLHSDEYTTENSQMLPIKLHTASDDECIYTSEVVNDIANHIPEEDEDGEYDDIKQENEDHKIIIQQVLMQPKAEEGDDDDDDIHEIVEVQPDEYTIRVR